MNKNNELTQPKSTALVARYENISKQVLERISEMNKGNELKLPKDYSAENALKSAYLTLLETKDRNGKAALEATTKESQANALLDMVIQGLSPMKKQCYFIVYGEKLLLQRSYMGAISVAKRLGAITDVNAQVIYEGDDFVYEIKNGKKTVVSHKQEMKNVNNDKIKGAYAVLMLDGKEVFTEVMNINQIRAAWNQGATHGASPAHKNFPDQMAMKTVINRACKLFINTSDDAALYEDKTEEIDENLTTASVKNTIKNEANKEELEITPHEEVKGELEINNEMSDEEKAAIEKAELEQSEKERASRTPNRDKMGNNGKQTGPGF